MNIHRAGQVALCAALFSAEGHAQLPPPPASPAPAVRYEYDAEGSLSRLIRAPGALNLATRHSIDALKRRTVTVDPQGHSTQMRYDGHDRLAAVVDPRSLATQYVRNGLDDLQALTSPDTGVSSFGFDAAGNLLTSVDSRGAQTSYEYDALDRPIRRTHTLPGQATETFHWRYDESGPLFGFGVGRLTTARFPGGSSSYGYDAQGRVTRVSTEVDSPWGALTLNTNYEYDLAGNVVQIVYPSGRVLRIVHAAGLPASMSVAASLSAAALPLISDLRFELSPGGQRTPRSWFWHLATSSLANERSFDLYGRMVRYPVSGAWRDITYDAADRIVRYSHLDVAGTASPAVRALDQTFEYDASDRLTRVIASTGDTRYSYDANGNRLVLSLGTAQGNSTRVHLIDPQSNRLVAIDNPSWQYTHDAAGNIVTAQLGLQRRSAEYGAAGRMQRLSSFDERGLATDEAHYHYDHNGLRAVKVLMVAATKFIEPPACLDADPQPCPPPWPTATSAAAGAAGVAATTPSATSTSLVAPSSGSTMTPVSAVAYMYDLAGRLLGEYDAASGTVLREYVWLQGMPIALIDGPAVSPEIYYVHTDHLDTPRTVIDRAGRQRWTWMAEPFGNSRPVTNPLGLGDFVLNLRMPGQYFDQESGLVYNWHRTYDSAVGRYTQSDPIGLAGGINPYVYVENQPTKYIDPTGLETYICRRPLGGKPGSYAPPLLNHTYVCVGSGANMVCGSTTASSGGTVSNIIRGSPGAPTTPATDYYSPDACERRWGEDSCIESCIANALKNPNRPKYGVGPAGTDCQEFTEDVVRTCERRCVRR